MARLLADENFPFPVVDTLRRLGHDVATLADLGHAGQRLPDAAVLATGHSEQRAVLTLNRRDFFRLHREVADHAGIIACTFDPDFDGQTGRIQAALLAEGDLRGRMLRVNRPALS